MGLGVSLAYGLSNFMGPVLARRHGSIPVLLISQLLAVSMAALLLVASGDARPSGAAVGYGVLAGAGNLVAITSLYRAASIGPMSLVMPINACGSIVPALWAEAHGRSLALHSIVAIVMVLGGAMLAAHHRRPPDEGAVRPASRIRTTIVFSVVSAIGYGVLLVALTAAAEQSTWWAIFDSRAVLFAGLAGGVLLFARSAAIRPPMGSVSVLAVPGLLLLAGSVLYVVASVGGDISIVAVLSSLYPLVTVALAILLLRERPTILQRAGIAVAIAGTVLLAA
jgi:drug/metabolite transporter (DMT)-like permease